MTQILSVFTVYSMLVAGCGDLVFSSSMVIVLLFALTLQHYGNNRFCKVTLWMLTFVYGNTIHPIGFRDIILHCRVGLLSIASRRHYSLDIFIASYTVPLLWIACDKFVFVLSSLSLIFD